MLVIKYLYENNPYKLTVFALQKETKMRSDSASKLTITVAIVPQQ